MTQLRIAPVPYQPHLMVVHPDKLGQSLVLRIPEFISSDGSRTAHPAHVIWDEIQPQTELRYRWDEPDEVKRDWATDFTAHIHAGDDEVTFEVTTRNLGDQPHAHGPYLFCLQAGAHLDFQDYNGERTFVRLPDRWASVYEMQSGRFEEHRMCGYQRKRDGIVGSVMAKVSTGGDWVLAIALDQDGGVSSNHQPWPSCIHANPAWPPIAPGDSATACGKIYFFRTGGLEALDQHYRADFPSDD